MNMKILKKLKQHLTMLVTLTLSSSIILLAVGCGEVDGGKIQNEVQLPVDSSISFSCADEGIHLEKCVLDNPHNPYANVAVSEDNKFALNDSAPSAKSRYYLWATALAKGAGAQGENQFFTAKSLQEVFAESGSPSTRDQSVKAYRSVLDNYFLASTFFVIIVDEEEVKFAASLKDIVGENLHDPTAASLVSLYTDPIFALEDISEWGYVYDTTNKIMSVFQ